MKLKKWIYKTASACTPTRLLLAGCILLTAGCGQAAQSGDSDTAPTHFEGASDPESISASPAGGSQGEIPDASSPFGTITDIPSEYAPTPAGTLSAPENLSGLPAQTDTEPSSYQDTPTPTPSPTEKPDSYLTPLADGTYSVPEEIIEELSYASNSYPRIFARYQGTLNGFVPTDRRPEYIIDILELDILGLDMVLQVQIDRFHAFETIRQTFTIPFEEGCWDLPDGLWITDLNGDGIDDFIVDLGTPLARISDRAVFFVYDRENDCYKNLGFLYDATFHEDEGVIYEFHYTEADHFKPDLKASIVRNKYVVEGSALVLLESLTETFPYREDGTRREPFPSFTLRQNIDGELKTIYSNVSAEKIDFSVWPERDQNKRVK